MVVGFGEDGNLCDTELVLLDGSERLMGMSICGRDNLLS